MIFGASLYWLNGRVPPGIVVLERDSFSVSRNRPPGRLRVIERVKWTVDEPACEG